MFAEFRNHVIPTTVTTVPVTSGVVIFIIAITVTLPSRVFAGAVERRDTLVTSWWGVSAIEALALCAEFDFHRTTTAVATIPATSGVVIVIIAISVSLPFVVLALAYNC